MNIKNFSEKTGISIYTIRYYEKIGIFRNVNRNRSGHRFFTDIDILWAEFIHRLKDTGMSLNTILEYANLREEGEHTTNSRMSLLKKHAIDIEGKIAAEKIHLAKIKEKIDHYKKLLKDQDLS
jgi:DNA-binding transcriptional MerR regulator